MSLQSGIHFCTAMRTATSAQRPSASITGLSMTASIADQDIGASNVV